MKKLFSIKWELIILIVLFATTVVSIEVYHELQQDWKTLFIAMICMSLLIIWIIGYSTIKNLRHEIISRW